MITFGITSQLLHMVASGRSNRKTTCKARLHTLEVKYGEKDMSIFSKCGNRQANILFS